MTLSDHTLILLCGAAVLAGLAAYVVLGGADFGGGVWDLFAFGPRAKRQRDAIAHAIGPVWEANHVWLIFVLVMLFTCFPRGYAVLAEALFVPFHLALLGIMLRGAAFIFRAYGPSDKTPAERKTGPAENSDESHHPAPDTSAKNAPSPTTAALAHSALWQAVFGAASIITPFLLGAAFGAITSGGFRVDAAGHVRTETDTAVPWLSPYCIGCGLLALSTCAYLAAVYLVVETRGDLREDFRRRAILAGTATACLAAVVLALAWSEANWFFHALVRWDAWPVLLTGLLLFASSAWAVFTRRYRLAPVFAAGEVILLLIGWGLAQIPYLIYPNMTLVSAAAPASTLRFMLIILPPGLALVLPSLWLLMHVFKKETVVSTA